MTWLLILPVVAATYRLGRRRRWAAGRRALFYPETGSVPGYIVGWAFSTALFWGVLFRFGLLAFAAMYHVLEAARPCCR